MASIKTIAAKAGVSRGTVDRVLHNRGEVKPETAEKIRAAIAELDFQPNPIGRALNLARKENKIGVLVSLREPDFQRQIMKGIDSGITYARQHSVETLLEYASPDDPDEYLAALERLLESEVQGLVLRGIGSHAVSERLRDIRNKKIPIIVYNQDIEVTLRDCFVGQNSCQSGLCAAALMQQMIPAEGTVLSVGVTPQHVSSEERIRGFAAHFQRQHTVVDVTNVIYGGGDHDTAYRLTREQLERLPDLTGIFVSGAGLSGAAQAVDDAGLTGRIKVVGFDVTDSNATYLRKGTVQFLIDQGPYDQGYRSIQLLTDAVFRDKPVAVNYYNTGIQIKNLYNLATS